MSEWLKDVEPLTLKGQIAVPYTWQAGEVGSKFLISLRDDQKNPWNEMRQVAERSMYRLARIADVVLLIWMSGSAFPMRALLRAFTIVHYSHVVQPVKAPFAYALIKLDGADCRLSPLD